MILAGISDLPVIVQLLLGLLALVAVVAVAWPVARSNWKKSTAAVWKEHAEALEARLEDMKHDVDECNARAERAERKVEAMETANRMLLRDAMGVDALQDLAREVKEMNVGVTARFDTLISLQKAAK